MDLFKDIAAIMKNDKEHHLKIEKLSYDTTPTLLFGSELYGSLIRTSNIKNYKYDWYWDKVRGVGHLNAKKQPMKGIETISVFYKKQCLYNPHMKN